MMRYKYCLIVAAAIIMVSGCRKYNKENPLPPTPTQLLTAGPWKLISFGLDLNKNGSIDSNEEAIKDCERDNTYTFNKDGSGLVMEYAMVCDGYDDTILFNWALTNNDTVLDFYSGKAYILGLSENNLIITDSFSEQVKLIFKYVR